MAKLDQINVGDTVFSAEWGGLSANATVTRVEGDEYWAELRLGGSPAAEAWTAGDVSDSFDIFAFGAWLDGPGLPTWWGDLDGDGKPELLAAVPKGDLSPPMFRVFRWTGEDLLFLRKRALLRGSDGLFVFSRLDDEQEETAWIESFDGSRAEVFALENGKLARESVEVEPAPGGFRRVR